MSQASQPRFFPAPTAKWPTSPADRRTTSPSLICHSGRYKLTSPPATAPTGWHGLTKKTLVILSEIEGSAVGNAGPSTALRFGRDDKLKADSEVPAFSQIIIPT